MTAIVIPWPRHHLHRCKDPYCYVCRGGLADCTVCGGAEGDLPTCCPGQWMTPTQRAMVYAGEADYLRGKGWVRPSKVKA